MNTRSDRKDLADLTRLKELVMDSSFDAVLATGMENVTYCSGFYDPGFRTMPNRMHVAIWPRGGEPAFIVPEYRIGAKTSIADVRGYDFYVRDVLVQDPRGRSRMHRWPIDLLAAVLREKGIADGRIGLEKGTFPVGAYEALQQALPEAAFFDCGSLFDEARMVKTTAEVEILRRAGTTTEKAIQFSFELAQPGKRSSEVAEDIVCNLTRLGAEQVAFVQLDVIRAGRRMSYDRHPVALMEGDWIRVDAGGYFSGYYSDVARMAVVGSPAGEQLSTYRRLHDVQSGIIRDVLRPAVPGRELFRETRDVFESRGFDTPWGMIVHGIGLYIHERPWIREQESYALPPGAVLCVEAISHGPADEMWHIEDLVLITEDGSRELTTYASTDDPFVID